jgi:hypothetical protein
MAVTKRFANFAQASETEKKFYNIVVRAQESAMMMESAGKPISIASGQYKSSNKF